MIALPLVVSAVTYASVPSTPHSRPANLQVRWMEAVVVDVDLVLDEHFPPWRSKAIISAWRLKHAGRLTRFHIAILTT